MNDAKQSLLVLLVISCVLLGGFSIYKLEARIETLEQSRNSSDTSLSTKVEAVTVQMDVLRRQNLELQENKKNLTALVDDLRSNQQEGDIRMQSDIRSIEARLEGFYAFRNDFSVYKRSAAQQRSDEERALYSKMSYTVPLFIFFMNVANNGIVQSGPVKFSDFSSAGWIAALKSYRAVLNDAARRYHNDIFELPSYDGKGVNLGDNSMLSGINYSWGENSHFMDGKSEKIYVYAPALAQKNENSVSIETDKDLDIIYLDGCLKWTLVKSQGADMKWEASDASGVKKIILVHEGTPVSVMPICEPNYLWIDGRSRIRKLWRLGDTSSSASMPKTGVEPVMPAAVNVQSGIRGIGIQFLMVGNGGKIVHVLPDSPAARAGLTGGNIITQVNGKPIAGMKDADVRSMIKTSGEIVQLTYQESSDPQSKITTVSIPLEFIVINKETLEGYAAPMSQTNPPLTVQESYALDQQRYLAAAQKGDPVAEYELAMLYLNTNADLPDKRSGVVDPDGEAFHWLYKSAQKNNRNAQLALAEMYRTGRGCVQKNQDAYLWALIAARPVLSDKGEIVTHYVGQMIGPRYDEFKTYVKAQTYAEKLKTDLEPKLAEAVRKASEDWIAATH